MCNCETTFVTVVLNFKKKNKRSSEELNVKLLFLANPKDSYETVTRTVPYKGLVATIPFGSGTVCATKWARPHGSRQGGTSMDGGMGEKEA